MRRPALLHAGCSSLISPHNAKSLMRNVLLLACLTALAGTMAAQQTVTVSGVPPAVESGRATLLGHYSNPEQMLRLVITLQPPHPAEEAEFIRQLSDPASPNFHQYLTQEESAERFAPSLQDEQAVVTWAQSQGLTVTQRYPNRLLVDVEAPVDTIEKTFAVNINSYQMGEETYFSNDRDPAIPAALGSVIHSVMGLNNIQVKHTHFPRKPTPVYSPGPSSVLGTPLAGDGSLEKFQAVMKAKQEAGPPEIGGAYDPTDIYKSTAYNYLPLQGLGHCCNPLNNAGNSPAQSSIAIAIGGDFLTSDISSFASYFGLAFNVQRVLLSGAKQCTGSDCDAEATLDTEWTTATANSFGSASDTAKVYVYESPDYAYASLLDAIEKAASDGQARVLNMSWGSSEQDTGLGYANDYDNVFKSMAEQGWTLVAAGGDGGATTDCIYLDEVSSPASDPYVTAVGGTTLTIVNGSYQKEVGWTGGSQGCANNDGGGGGGCSVFFTTDYQGGAACSKSYRSVPDIALNADWENAPEVLYYTGSWYASGGTSVASPQMVGFVAQENAYLLYVGSINGNTCGSNNNAACSPMGRASAYLYPEGLNPFAPHYPFYDITSGCNNNDITHKYGLSYFCAGAGYDRVTGWGSVNMFQLAWTINFSLAGDGEGPAVDLSGPPTHHWYTTDQSVSWTMSDRTSNGHRPIGSAGASFAWDADPGDPSHESHPGSGGSYYGLQTYGSKGSKGGLSSLSQGCHTADVRGWDNAGNSSLGTYGPLCFDNIPPVTTTTLSGNGQNGSYNGPVLVSLSATDNASGVAATSYVIDSGAFQPYGGPVYVWLPGNHQVTAYSIDVAGNIEQFEITNFTIQQNTQFAVTVARSGTGSGTVTSMDGQINCGATCSAMYYDEEPITLTATPAQGSVFIGWQNCDLSFGLSCTLTVTAARTVTAIFNVPVALQFVPVTPCRVVDTRNPNDGFSGGTLQGNSSRSWSLPSSPNLASCGSGGVSIPSTVAAYSLNITAVPHVPLNYLTAWPTGLTQPNISTLNSNDGRVKANAAILPAGVAGTNEAVSVYVTNTSDIILDIDGYFMPTTSSTLAFFPLTPCRLVDTRQVNNGQGFNNTQTFNLPQSATSGGAYGTCTPFSLSSAQAYSLNVTAVPVNGPVDYITIWPAGGSQPVVSTLNDYTGTVVANAAVVPAGSEQQTSVFTTDQTNLLIDINGYFAPVGSGQGPQSLYVFAPCRVLDTRNVGNGQGFSGGPYVVNVVNSPCEVPSTAQGYVFNATVVPSGQLGYLALWPDGESQPVVSTLNAYDGAVTSNMAIVPNQNGSTDAYAQGTTQLILDISSYFAP